MIVLRKWLKIVKYGICSLRLLFRGNHIGKGVIVSRKAYLRKTFIGNYSYVAEFSELNCTDVGSYCSIGPAVNIGSMEHPYWKPSTSSRLFGDDCESEKRTTIGNDVWIGAQSFIKQGVRIGNGAVIGAQSFVNKDVPAYAIAFGTPAKVYRMRFGPEIIEAIEKSQFANFPPQKAKELLSKVEDMIDFNVHYS